MNTETIFAKQQNYMKDFFEASQKVIENFSEGLKKIPSLNINNPDVLKSIEISRDVAKNAIQAQKQTSETIHEITKRHFSFTEAMVDEIGKTEVNDISQFFQGLIKHNNEIMGLAYKNFTTNLEATKTVTEKATTKSRK